MPRGALRLAVAGICLAGSLSAARPAAASFPGENGTIVIARPGQRLAALDPDGTDPRLLHPDSTGAVAPRWSPEGNRIAALLGGDLVILDAAGAFVHTLTSSGDVAREPSWSPDGTRIAFVNAAGELWVASARNPGDATLLLGAGVVSAAWNPYAPADQIAYTDGGAILTVRSDGSEAGTELVPADPLGSTRSELAWHPWGEWGSITWTATAPDGTTHVEGPGFGIGDGNANGEDRSPAWSPDGKRLLFSRGGVPSVYTPGGDGIFPFVRALGVSGAGGGWQPSIVTSPAAYEGLIASGPLAQMWFRVLPPAGLPVTVDYATVPGSATDGANADYVATSGSVQTPTPYGRPETVAVPIVGDTDAEQDEFFSLELRFPSDPAVPLRVRGTILNDDGGRGRNGLIGYQADTGAMVYDPGNRRSETLVPGVSSPPIYSPAGDRYAYSYFDAQAQTYVLVVADADGQPLTTFATGGFGWGPAWSADGGSLAWVDSMTLVVGNPATGGFTQIASDVLSASWSNDTAFPRRLAYTRTSSSGSATWVAGEDGSGAIPIATDATVAEWSPDGSTIAYYGIDGVWFMDPTGANQRRVVFDGELFRWSPIVGASGRLFCVRRDDGRFVVRAETGPETLLPDLPQPVWNIDWSPDGNQLILEAEEAVTGASALWTVGADDAGTPFARLEQVAGLTPVGAPVTLGHWSAAPYRPTVIVEGARGFEGWQAPAPVRLSAPASQPVTVGFTWYDGTAIEGEDYAAPATNTVTLEPGETERDIVWSLLADQSVEGEEAFGFLLTAASGARIGTPSNAVGSIIDVPPQAPLQLWVGDASVTEGDSGESLLTFTVALTGTPSGPVDVQVEASDGTATQAGGDYLPATGVLTLTAASPTATFDVRVLGDGAVEPDEFLLVSLSNPTGGASIADGQGTGTVLSDDAAPVLDPIGDLGARPELTAISFTATALDADGDAVSFSLVGAPPGATIDAASGAFDWTPAEDQGPSAWAFSVRAQDPAGNFADAPVTVVITEVNTAPVLTVTGLPGGPVDPGTLVTLLASASDSDLPSNGVSFSLAGAPAGASIDAASGVFAWTPSAAQAGSHTFDVIATDDGAPPLAASQTLTIVVNAPPPPGGGESVSATFGPGGGTLTTDTEGDGATPADPIETEVASPLAGTVSIAEPDPAPPAPPTAWSFLGQLAQISAPVATVADPLRLLFLLDASVAVPAGGAAAIAVFRNGVEVGPCTGAPQAVPDPCVESRQDLADGDAQLVILTSQASEWRFGTPRVTRGLAFAVASPETGGVLSLSASSHNGVPLGGLAYLKGGAVFRSAGLIAFAVDAGRRAWIAGIGHDGRRFLLYAEDNGPSGDRIRLWIDGVGQSGEGALRSGGVWIRP